MSARERPRSSRFEIFWGVLTLAVIAVIAWPQLKSTIGALPIGIQWNEQATAMPGSKPINTALPSGSGSSTITISNPIAVPAVNVEATSAAYNATEQARIPQVQPNVNNTGDSAPVVRMQKENAIEPASGIVPTAEPIQQTQSDDNFGSKPAAPINIQETHTCLHGQIWTDRGCKNPTPTN